MIAFLEGKLLRKKTNSVIVTSGGVGWEVFLSREALKKMPQPGGNVKLWTALHQRKDGRSELYGFLSEEEEAFFETLNGIAGIGPKSALAILAVAPLAKLKAAIASGSEALLSRVSGIGSKTAQRIIVELKNQFSKEAFSQETLTADMEAEDALVNLGYSRKEARQALTKVAGSFASTPERVREALKIITRNP